MRNGGGWVGGALRGWERSGVSAARRLRRRAIAWVCRGVSGPEGGTGEGRDRARGPSLASPAPCTSLRSSVSVGGSQPPTAEQAYGPRRGPWFTFLHGIQFKSPRFQGNRRFPKTRLYNKV
ncbi:hypothetical protein GCM10022206_27300 [Streptomyces chiangmaiensis]